MRRILILGAGGHAQVIADILTCSGEVDSSIQLIGYLDDNPQLSGQSRLGYPILGAIGELRAIDHDAVIVGIGHNQRRRTLFEHLRSEGERFAVACHPRAIVARDVVLPPGSVVCAGVVINCGSLIGENTILNTSCTVDHHNQIGSHAHIAPGAHLGGDVIVGTGALIGIGATVMPQRKVGPWSTVGAGALVQRDIPEHVVAIGVPAQIVSHLQPQTPAT
jgi:sugar O-acyltransferase (sialic acid O-acetyltransferase NeuD family)